MKLHCAISVARENKIKHNSMHGVLHRRPSHRAGYRFYRRLTFRTWLPSTKMVTVWKYSNLPVMFATWIWAVSTNLCGRCELSSCAFNCLSKQFGEWLMLWLKLTILFSKAYSIHLHYAIHFTNNVRQSQVFNWVILSQIIQLIQVNETLHDSTEWGCFRKVCAKREFMCKRYLP